ncbi:general substrate transporter [Serendipita vermifera]|nr:general substrate transporter [Serendipita vermifera]
MASFTKYAVLGVIPWLCLTPFQYGYAISQLNQIQHAVTCNSTATGKFDLPVCVPMNDTNFGLTTSIFTIGGLLASLLANRIIDPYGRKPAVQLNAMAVALGSALLAIGSSVLVLAAGRFIIGLGAGLGLCVIPSFLSEISPPKIRDSVGLLNQLSVVIGILITQVLGFYLAQPGYWRLVFVFSFSLSITQWVIGTQMVESPAWLAARNRKAEARAISAKLWQNSDGSSIARGLQDDEDLEEALLRDAEPIPNQNQPSATIAQCFKIPELRRPLMIVSLSMLTQQISGINAVMYYSTAILSRSLPNAASYVSLGVAVINVIMTFPPIFVIEKYGQRRILLYSVIGSILALLLLATSLNYNINTTSAIGTLLFVSCFAFGLGPIPFIIIPDVSPLYAVSALSSIALSLNWLVNFVVGMAFLPLQAYLEGSKGEGSGNIFYIFTLLLTVSAVSFFRYF